MSNYPKHYCGIFGVFGSEHASRHIERGLFALQHRGQEGTGIVTTDGKEFFDHRAMGLVSQAYGNGVLEKLTGAAGIGHNRYSTTGGSELRNVQPLCINCQRGTIALGHNGNLINTNLLRNELAQAGAIFQTATDSEVMLHLIARETGTMTEAIETMMRRVEGAYSLVILTADELIGVRDPHGIRPLMLGMLPNGETVMASETCALDAIGATTMREILPGEIVSISSNGQTSHKMKPACRASCIFEHVYFARPDSAIDGTGKSVYGARIRMGEILAEEYPICDADIVVPIPDGGTYAAMGYSRARGIPLELAFVRNHYSGRSFIEPTQAQREATVNAKLNLVPDLVKEKRVIVIDDSIVRGTTIRMRVDRLRRAGASAVHILVSCPPHRYSCHYGIDFPDRRKLIAVAHSNSEILRQVGADSIGYLSETGLLKAVGGTGYCMACFNGVYPTNSTSYSI